jgi:SAM-dependent methyltransferase
MADDVFKRYSTYYDLLYRDKDYVAEAAYIGETLRSASPQLRSVLELGSGTGKHGRLLAAAGFEVFGVERSSDMVEHARRAPAQTGIAGSFDCAIGDVRTAALGRKFDSVISLFHVVSYQTTNEAVLQTFATAHRHLEDGGFFFFDCWHGPAVLFDRPVVRVKRVEDESTRLIRIAEPALDSNACTVTVNYTVIAEDKQGGQVDTLGESHLMRYFFPQEIALIAAQSGFRLRKSQEFLTGCPPSEQTWGGAYLMQRTP